MDFTILFGSLALLCFFAAFKISRKGHPFNVLALIVLNCGLLVLDVFLFSIQEYIGTHITSYSSLIFPLGLIVFYRNLHTTSLSRVDKILLGIALCEYLLIILIYVCNYLFGADCFSVFPSDDVISGLARNLNTDYSPFISFAIAKDLLLFLIQQMIFPIAFYIIGKELFMAKKRHLDYFTLDSFNFYSWNVRVVSFIAFCYIPISIIVFHDFFIEYVALYRNLAYILIVLFGLGLGALIYRAPNLKAEEHFEDFIHHLKEVENPNTAIDNAKRKEYVDTILSLVEQEKLYRDPKVNLDSLSSKLDISSRHLSRIINENILKSFSEFINTYRVEEVKQKLKDSSYDHYTILGIGLEAGFSSKTTFYTTFKKFTGMNPAQFKKSSV